jgi:hypothetical protein
MGKAERAKGGRAERELAALWEAAGCSVRGLEGLGDHLIVVAPVYDPDESMFPRDVVTFHSEVKAQETLRLPLWRRQAVAEAPPGTIPVVFTKQRYAGWWADLRAEDLIRLVTR